MLSDLETQLQGVMLRDQFRFRRQFAQLKRAKSQQRLNEDELLKLAIRKTCHQKVLELWR